MSDTGDREERSLSHIHLVGIGGAGLSAIANVLFEEGYRVSGCDRVLSSLSDALTRRGVTVYQDHSRTHVEDADILLISSAIPPGNADVVGAKVLGVPVVKRAEFLGELMRDRLGIAIAGTHGKTTTAGMVAWMLSGLGYSPTYIVGSPLPDLGTNARAGNGDAFVIEADEYDQMFLGLRPRLAVVTSLEWDHPDCYPTFEDYQNAFARFIDRIPANGLVIACEDDLGVQWLREGAPRKCGWWGYGMASEVRWQATQVRANEQGGSDFLLLSEGEPCAEVNLLLPGEHNVLNATAALASVAYLGGDVQEASHILGQFRGAARRFEMTGSGCGIIVLDDYGHHPTEIRATLAAVRQRYPQHDVWAVFQPHTYSRTRVLLHEFAAAFSLADHVIVTDIYPSREQDDGSIHARDVVGLMSHPDVRYIGPLCEAATYLTGRLASNSLVITLGAGDGNRVGQSVLAALEGSKGD